MAGAAVTGRGRLEPGQVELSAILNADNFLSLNPWMPDLPVPLNLTVGTVEFSRPVDPLWSDDNTNTRFNSWSGNGTVQLNMAGGTISGQCHLTGDRWQGSMTAENLNLNPFAPNLPEPINLATGSLYLSGFLTSFAPQDIQAEGEFTLIHQPLENSPQPSLLAQFFPLYSAFRWTGETLEIQQAKAPGLEVDGEVLITVQCREKSVTIRMQGTYLRHRLINGLRDTPVSPDRKRETALCSSTRLRITYKGHGIAVSRLPCPDRRVLIFFVS